MQNLRSLRLVVAPIALAFAAAVVATPFAFAQVTVQPPGVPTIGAVVAGDSQVFVTFTPPTSNGGARIMGFAATCNPGAVAVSGTASPIQVPALNNGTAYTCSVVSSNGTFTSGPSATASATPVAAAPVALVTASSRKVHGTAGTYEIPLDTTQPIGGAVTSEPRAQGTGHVIVFKFNGTVTGIGGPVTAVDDLGAPITTTPVIANNEVAVQLGAVADGKRVTVTVPAVNGTLDASTSVMFLFGDVSNTRTVNSSDISGVKARSGQATDFTNFRDDINVNGAINSSDILAVKARSGAGGGGPVDNPIMFVAQVPSLGDFGGRGSTFGNHLPDPESVVRGGDLMIRYPDGTLRNLTREAGFGMDGLQVDNGNQHPIAVREPTVHWNGTKAVFSMLVGGYPHFQRPAQFWQLYEVTNLGKGQVASITKVPNQPTNYNNVSPFYGTDDRVLFTSDRPRNGAAHLYPQLDEYETAPVVSGIWSMDPTVAGGDLRILNHAPSGAFSPSIDSFGRVIFTRWDHMQQDQQADDDRANPANPPYHSFNFTNELANSTYNLNNRAEIFPETRSASNSVYGPVLGYTSNFFTPWMMNEDGTEEETLNHVGRHELAFGFLGQSFTSDPALNEDTNDAIHANQKKLSEDHGIFHLREDPLHPGTYYGTAAKEFGSLTSNQLVKLTGAPNLNAEQMVMTDVTRDENGNPTTDGRFRNPLPLTTGQLIASHTNATDADPALIGGSPFRLKTLTFDAVNNVYVAGAPLTGAGITKSVSWYSPDDLLNFPDGVVTTSNVLWEIEAVEVVARPRPVKPQTPLPTPESNVFASVGVDPAAFRTWLKDNDLALIVTRNQTSRDRADLQQPYNLRVPGGTSTVKPGNPKVYDIAHYQILQADLIRGFGDPTSPDNPGGRRVIAQTLHDDGGKNALYAPNPGGPAGSVKIAPDGSTAAFVPTRRALAWQTTDAAGVPVVRERVWLTMQPGEIRVCASCHGTNTKDQIGQPAPANEPQALKSLLQAWLQAH